MENQHVHHHGCTQCACNNPVLEVLKEELFSPENLAKMKPGPGLTGKQQPHTLLISGGTIRPMSGGSTDTVEAIGIADGNVVANGTQSVVTAYMEQNYPGYKNKVLTGTQTLLPGLIEPHVHIVPTAMMTEWADVSPFNGQDLLGTYDLDSVGTIINANLPDNLQYVILGKGLDPSLMPFVINKNGEEELVTIDNHVLDGIRKDIPMMLLSASMHTLYLNTSALHYVFNNNEDVRKEYKLVNLYIAKTKGQLQESLMMTPALTVIKQQVIAMANNIDSYLTELFKLANQRGATFMYDAGLNTNFEKILLKYLSSNHERVRIGGALLCSTPTDVANLSKYPDTGTYTPVYNGHVKVVSDGSNQGLTGYQSSAYLCEPKHNIGIFNFKDANSPKGTIPQNYQDLISGVVKQGWPLMIHANGDLAVTFAIEAYQTALAQAGATELRNRIEHCSLLTADQISAMYNMGISPSFLIGHVGYWGYAFSQVIFGSTKAQMLDLCGSALSAGMRITLHSDNEVSPLGPLRMMEQSITRIMEESTANGAVLNPEECITPEQALVAVTYDAAWQCYADQWAGSLDEGYFADFVILEQDPLSLTTPTEQFMKMRNIPVLETWLGGVPVHILLDEKSPES
jgi:predicted amidohydrolase YtcJ